jgi:hypothetical protein
MSENNNWILIPVYNDWTSLRILLGKIINVLGVINNENFKFLIIDDGSSEKINKKKFSNFNLTYLQLRRNLGHQRAIAIGLAYLNAAEKNISKVIVMDADGEDDPEVIPALLDSARMHEDTVIFSSRTKRNEGIIFRLGYFIYKRLFHLLTGRKISFGNFSLIPCSLLNTIVNISEIWNHYSGGILKAGIKKHAVPSARAKRISGKSSMSLISLILHGLRSIAVYLDRVAARLLIFFILMVVVLFTGMIIVLYFKYFTDLAIPGWATSAMSGLLILMFQAILISLFIVFIVLNQNTQRQLIPALDYADYIGSVEQITDDE